MPGDNESCKAGHARSNRSSGDLRTWPLVPPRTQPCWRSTSSSSSASLRRTRPSACARALSGGSGGFSSRILGFPKTLSPTLP